MSSSSSPTPKQQHDIPSQRSSRVSWIAAAAAASQRTTVLDTGLTPPPTAPVPSTTAFSQDAELCNATETQELLDNFFTVYAPPNTENEQNTIASDRRVRVRSERHNDVLAGGEEEEEEEEEDVEEGPLRRLDDHHAQQSQYVPDDEDGEEDSGAAAAAAAEDEEEGDDADKHQCIAEDDDFAAEEDDDDPDDAEAMGAASPSAAHTLSSMPREVTVTAGISIAEEVLQETQKEKAAPGTSSSPSLPPSAAPASEDGPFWPYAEPPSLDSMPHCTQTRAAFHTQRYGAFIKAYLGLSDQEVRQAERRGRGICMMGIRRVTRYNKSSTSAATGYSFWSPRGMPKISADNLASPHHPFRRLRTTIPEAVRTQRVFLRHSVLAVEGDAMFCQLIDRAESLYAVEQQRLDAAAAAYSAVKKESNDAMRETEVKYSTTPSDVHASSSSSSSSVHFPQFRKLPRVAEPYLRPNARCIALHYGLPDAPSPTSAPPAATTNPFPRATLIAVVTTTRLEDNTEVYVSMDSYYRCLDEVAWYRRCYAQMNARYGCRATLTRDASTVGKTDDGDAVVLEAADGGVGDVYTGVKRFAAWPADLSYYHGVGRRHASAVAEAAFPFTLVDLGAAPELGEGQKGVVASAWLPYGTCLLYCGPSVATRKVERLVSALFLNGGQHSGTTDGQDEDAVHADGVGGEEGDLAHAENRDATVGHENPATPTTADGDEDVEEDLSFVTDDTYALGLGRHGVCFGQGLTRYINHRYNTSRFGNVELCSVMLSVPSEFAADATKKNNNNSSISSAMVKKSAASSSSAAAAAVSSSSSLTADPTLTEDENRRIRKAVKKAYQQRTGASTKESATASAGCGSGARTTRGKRKAAPPRRARRIFLEEKSLFVTVPFFLVTTDIPPGDALLAWTYGEDYDAKLERQAVADGHLVPYADAAVLNRRLLRSHRESSTTVEGASACSFTCSHQPLRRFQRYNGDYRYAVGIGDIVWRRRAHASPLSLSSTCATSSVPPPEDDLFVVVQTQNGGVEHVLLQSLDRVDLEECDLRALLAGQHLLEYVSPHAAAPAAVMRHPARADADVKTEAKEEEEEGETAIDEGKRTWEDTSACGKEWNTQPTHESGQDHLLAALNSTDPPSTDLRDHWALFRVPHNSPLNESLSLPLARAEDALRRCVVATVESVGLLLADIDYSIVHRHAPAISAKGTGPRTGGEGAEGVRGKQSRKGTAAAAAATAAVIRWPGDAGKMILVNVDDLRFATRLVRTSADRAAALPALYNGLMWPLFSAQLERGGGATAGESGPRRRKGAVEV